MSAPRLAHDWFPDALPANVALSADSWCYSTYAFQHYQSRRPCGVSVGRRSGIYHGTFFQLGPDGEVSIGDYCAIVSVIFATNRRIVIGDYAFLSHDVVFADQSVTLPAPTTPTGPGITLGNNVWIGARTTVLGGSVIGDGSVIGAGSVVSGEVPPYVVAAGSPLRIVKRLDPG